MEVHFVILKKHWMMRALISSISFVKQDYYSSDYNQSTSHINSYYRKIIEEMQMKYQREIDRLTLLLSQEKNKTRASENELSFNMDVS